MKSTSEPSHERFAGEFYTDVNLDESQIIPKQVTNIYR